VETNRYIPEIQSLRKEIPKYTALSFIAGALVFILSKMKQKIINYKISTGLASPIVYTRFEKIFNKTMLLHDNRPLP